MAQESFEINPHVLCSHRDKLGISQKQLVRHPAPHDS